MTASTEVNAKFAQRQGRYIVQCCKRIGRDAYTSGVIACLRWMDSAPPQLSAGKIRGSQGGKVRKIVLLLSHYVA